MTDRDVVKRIVDDLFVNGNGDKAERLVLTSSDGRNLGGWSKDAVVARILAGILAFLYSTPDPSEPQR
jgi:hypothetical protein